MRATCDDCGAARERSTLECLDCYSEGPEDVAEWLRETTRASGQVDMVPQETATDTVRSYPTFLVSKRGACRTKAHIPARYVSTDTGPVCVSFGPGGQQSSSGNSAYIEKDMAAYPPGFVTGCIKCATVVCIGELS